MSTENKIIERAEDEKDKFKMKYPVMLKRKKTLQRRLGSNYQRQRATQRGKKKIRPKNKTKKIIADSKIKDNSTVKCQQIISIGMDNCRS